MRKNGKRRSSQCFVRFMEALFLSPRLGIASRKLSIVCSLALGQGQISSQRSDVQARLPSRTATRDKRRCTRRLRRTHPSLQQRWFHVRPASSEAPLVPRLCGRCVLLQLVVCFGNQGLSAKPFTILNLVKTGKY